MTQAKSIRSILPYLLMVSLIVPLILNSAPSEAASTKYAAASWFGPEYHGKKTASGVIYDMNSNQAAHKTLPFGTNLRVTNPRNGKSTIVRITDRGPFTKSREIDLSRKCAMDIGIANKGVACVKIDYIFKDAGQTKYVDITDMNTLPERFTTAIAFVDYKNAAIMKNLLTRSHAKHIYVEKSTDSGQTLYLVSTAPVSVVRHNAPKNITLLSAKKGRQSAGLSALKRKIDRERAATMVALMSYGSAPTADIGARTYLASAAHESLTRRMLG
ncbi:MAG: septal ring lytic transglycosylase RlpA family protein [Candidatus Magnetominusculus sp. LBB02]|nr:septal ring lytic transglycosylase RlpA family protein [Candidatus Magnetominusculus sp. LBB02]